ncbi:hypothetical protein DVH24_013849, partial [Malus domestica]
GKSVVPFCVFHRFFLCSNRIVFTLPFLFVFSSPSLCNFLLYRSLFCCQIFALSSQNSLKRDPDFNFIGYLVSGLLWCWTLCLILLAVLFPVFSVVEPFVGQRFVLILPSLGSKFEGQFVFNVIRLLLLPKFLNLTEVSLLNRFCVLVIMKNRFFASITQRPSFILYENHRFTFFQKKINMKIQLRCKSLRLLNVYNSSFPTLYPKLQLKTSTHNPLFCKASPLIIIHLKVHHSNTIFYLL